MPQGEGKRQTFLLLWRLGRRRCWWLWWWARRLGRWRRVHRNRFRFRSRFPDRQQQQQAVVAQARLLAAKDRLRMCGCFVPRQDMLLYMIYTSVYTCREYTGITFSLSIYIYISLSLSLSLSFSFALCFQSCIQIIACFTCSCMKPLIACSSKLGTIGCLNFF